ncbi:MAG: T9SS type A sorting domain-containing protein [Calditrichaceae bacterium]|nr:T9SS type A sorting domain-containing protein [Calditrichia bacterium]NUQ43670.1 T9SS type A sorting domain-containing protein [Calditrichaceae bacterium]
MDGIDYDQAFNELSEALRSVIQSNLGVNTIQVGLLSLDEDQNESEGQLWDFQIEVDYSIPIDVTITTSPEGLQFSVDGQNYTSSQTFGWWAGDEHTIGTTTPQTYNNTNYAFQNWSDGGAIIHQITPTATQTITANFQETISITVKNRWDSGFVKVDSIQYSSGEEFSFAPGSTHDFEAWEQNYGGYDMVFKPGEEKWITPDGPFYTALIQNHAVQDSGNYEAQLWRICNFTADNYFVDGGSGGYLNVTGQGQQSAPYSTQIVENNSIEVEAPTQTQTVNGKQITYNFLKWQDGGTANPRSFVPNAHTTITAEYKGHLVSTTSTATAYSNSRKVAVDQSGRWHMVYEDNGQIYYTYSTDNGQSWMPEESVSDADPYGLNQYPSIHVEPVSPYLISVAWNVDYGDYHDFKWRVKPFSGNWGEEYSYWAASITPTKPAIMRRDYLYILAKVGGGLGLFRFDGSELELVGQVPGTDNNSENPAMTASPYYPSGVLHFAWEQRNRIYFSYFLPPNTFVETEEVTVPKADIEINQQPSISYSYAATNQINVAWSGFDTDLNAYVLLHRQRSSNLYGQWGSLNEVYYSYYNLSHPSTGSFDVPFPGWVDVGLKFGNNSLRVIQYNGQNWRWVSGLLPGSHPSLNDQGENLMLLGTDNTTPLPYRVTSQLFAPVQWEEEGPSGESPLAFSPGKAIPAGENTLPAEIEKQFRKEIFQFSNLPGLTLRGNADISIGDVQIQSGDSSIAWPFTALTDTTRRKTFLQTEPLAITGDMQSLTLRYRARVRELQRPGAVPNLPLFRLRLVDASTGAPLMVLRMVNLNQLSGTQFNQEDSLAVNLQPYQGQQILLQMQTVFHLLAGPLQASEQVNLYAFYGTGALQAKLAGNSEPEEFALSQNYPNPFNPATTITLSLPQDSRVSLEVYDITGRKVRTLADQPLPAGVHKIAWDGRNEGGEAVSSGVYIYRVQAGAFVESRKMVLLR